MLVNDKWLVATSRNIKFIVSQQEQINRVRTYAWKESAAALLKIRA